jgi:hypothetical protein
VAQARKSRRQKLSWKNKGGSMEYSKKHLLSYSRSKPRLFILIGILNIILGIIMITLSSAEKLWMIIYLSFIINGSYLVVRGIKEIKKKPLIKGPISKY